MSKPQKHISGLTLTQKQPDMTEKKLKMTPKYPKIKKLIKQKSYKMRVIKEISKTYHKL